MALLSPTTLEDHPAGTLNIGGIINDNWQKLNKLFNPALSPSDPLYGLVALAVRGQGGGLTTITYGATPNIDFSLKALQLITLTGNAGFTFSNLGVSKTVRLLIASDGTGRNMTWPVGVNWVGNEVPTSIPASSYIIVDLISQTSSAGDVWGAAYKGSGGLDTYESKVLALNPLAYWPLNETSGTSFADSSGNGNTGTSSGTVTPNVDQAIIGSNNKAPNFVSASSGYITIPTTTALEIIPNSTAFSVSAWLRVATAADYGIVTKTGSGTNRNFQLSTTATANQINCFLGGTTNPIPAIGIANNLWHNIIVASNGTLARAYYDGRETTTITPGTQTEHAVDWLIGARRTGGTNVNTGASTFLNGFIAHVAIFNYQLSAAQAAKLSWNREYL